MDKMRQKSVFLVPRTMCELPFWTSFSNRCALDRETREDDEYDDVFTDNLTDIRNYNEIQNPESQQTFNSHNRDIHTPFLDSRAPVVTDQQPIRDQPLPMYGGADDMGIDTPRALYPKHPQSQQNVIPAALRQQPANQRGLPAQIPPMEDSRSQTRVEYQRDMSTTPNEKSYNRDSNISSFTRPLPRPSRQGNQQEQQHQMGHGTKNHHFPPGGAIRSPHYSNTKLKNHLQNPTRLSPLTPPPASSVQQSTHDGTEEPTSDKQPETATVTTDSKIVISPPTELNQQKQIKRLKESLTKRDIQIRRLEAEKKLQLKALARLPTASPPSSSSSQMQKYNRSVSPQRQQKLHPTITAKIGDVNWKPPTILEAPSQSVVKLHQLGLTHRVSAKAALDRKKRVGKFPPNDTDRVIIRLDTKDFETFRKGEAYRSHLIDYNRAINSLKPKTREDAREIYHHFQRECGETTEILAQEKSKRLLIRYEEELRKETPPISEWSIQHQVECWRAYLERQCRDKSAQLNLTRFDRIGVDLSDEESTAETPSLNKSAPVNRARSTSSTSISKNAQGPAVRANSRTQSKQPKKPSHPKATKGQWSKKKGSDRKGNPPQPRKRQKQKTKPAAKTASSKKRKRKRKAPQKSFLEESDLSEGNSDY